MAVETKKQQPTNTSNYNALTTHYECKEDAINQLNSLYSALESFIPLEEEKHANIEKIGSENELYNISISGEKSSNVMNEILNAPKNHDLGSLKFEGYEDSEGYRVKARLDLDKHTDELLELGIREIVHSYLEQ